jgi:hypothetical protein
MRALRSRPFAQSFHVHVFTRYIKVTFFRGTSLRPVPFGGTSKDARWIDIHEDDLDEAQLATWVKQTAALLREHLSLGEVTHAHPAPESPP